MPQNYNLFANKTVLENVTLGLTVGEGVPKDEAEKRAMEALKKVGMADRVNFYPECSFGRSAAARRYCKGYSQKSGADPF